MKVTTKSNPYRAGVLNVFSLGAISFTWAHFLGLISIYWLPVTLLMYVIGYGSEIGNTHGGTSNNNR